MGDIKFGTKQLGKPTPQGVSIWIDFSVGVIGVIGGFLTTTNLVPHSVSDPISAIISSLLTPILLYIKRFFGEQVSSAVVGIDNVAEIKGMDK